MRTLYLLGASGSIGRQTLDIISRYKDHFQLQGISLGSNHEINNQIIKEYDVPLVCLRKEEDLPYYQMHFPKTTFVYGDSGLVTLAKQKNKGLFINALSGSAGLVPTIQAIQSGHDIALANKETLVMAGDLINDLIQTYGVNLYPIDSEHSALWQIMRGEARESIQKLVITASGGSFRDYPRSELTHVTKEQALKHPNWSMGSKITIDSATMMNKGLEVIEAHHLFHLPYEKIETILHKESIVHGLIYFCDGTVKASMSLSDMRIPIQYALFYPERKPFPSELPLTNLSFQPMDYHRYPLLKLAYEVGHQGGLLPTVMNAANEAAVHLFLEGHIQFLEIETIVIETVNEFVNMMNPTIEDIIQTDHTIQASVVKKYEKR
jgi:1-deoxy-D-xylulose-5-phosphate reductoisomerase